LARPRKPNSRGGDEDDEPTYVHEETLDPISKDELTALLMDNKDKLHRDQTSSLTGPRQASGEEVFGSADDQFGDAKPSEQLLANIGGNSKRRLAKAIGENYESPKGIEHDNGTPLESPNSNRKEKRKMIKLSFEGEAGT
jgi:hypothetical protein